MFFIDRATIFVRAGNGGNGAVSFRREKYVPKGGPDGGDGGKGGDVILVGDPSYDTLLHLTHHPHYRAKNGGGGMGKSMHGGDGADIMVPIPLGTVVADAASGQVLADINQAGQTFLAAKGGAGGLGNEHFKSATHQTPTESTPGELGQDRTLKLELKLLADVGLVGLPNAGKSTLLRAVSRATPKVADYPFTTLSPHLGIAELPGDRRLVVADIPGLIEGAAHGAGLGHDFLRHIERTAVLVHVLDLAPLDSSDPARNYEVIRQELLDYSVELAEKPEIIVFNKIDLVPQDQRAAAVKTMVSKLRLPRDVNPILTSGATGEGVKEMLEACWAARGKRGEPATWLARTSART
ncbi:MAG: GTPase ObgE [Phycisphaerales bacterium]|nr:GTPase ObgE [Phycisphaerales bacterium]